jgi:purine nucleosidase
MGVAGTTHPDSMACAAIVDPSLVLAARPAFLDVETAGDLTRGYSHIDYGSATPNCTVVTDYDTRRFLELFLGIIS